MLIIPPAFLHHWILLDVPIFSASNNSKLMLSLVPEKPVPVLWISLQENPLSSLQECPHLLTISVLIPIFAVLFNNSHMIPYRCQERFGWPTFLCLKDIHLIKKWYHVMQAHSSCILSQFWVTFLAVIDLSLHMSRSLSQITLPLSLIILYTWLLFQTSVWVQQKIFAVPHPCPIQVLLHSPILWAAAFYADLFFSTRLWKAATL